MPESSTTNNPTDPYGELLSGKRKKADLRLILDVLGSDVRRVTPGMPGFATRPRAPWDISKPLSRVFVGGKLPPPGNARLKRLETATAKQTHRGLM